MLLGTIPGVLLMERFGRRFWALVTLPCFFIGLVLVGVSYQLNTLVATEGVYLTGIILYNGTCISLPRVDPISTGRAHGFLT